MAEPQDRPRLKLICAGTGRDGTLSLTQMLQDLFDREGAGRTAAHEYESRAFFEAAVLALEPSPEDGRAAASALIRACPFDAIIGNGYAPWLPLFAELCGPELTLVHLRRADREACVRSLADNARFFPTAYGGYVDSPDATSRRPAAFHHGEMSQGDWAALSLTEKLGWYYDHTHALIDRYAGLFPSRYILETERLNAPATLALIAEIAKAGPHAARPMHLNAHGAMAQLPADRRYKMQWLMGRFDLRQAADDDLYAFAYFANALIAWTGYQVRRSEHIGPEDYRSRAELEAMLDQATHLLEHTGHLVRLLRLELADAGAESANG